jgi:hypothetical protein
LFETGRLVAGSTRVTTPDDVAALAAVNGMARNATLAAQAATASLVPPLAI